MTDKIDWSKPLECALGDIVIDEAASCRGGSSKYLSVSVGENENKITWCVREDGAAISTRISFENSKVRNKETNKHKAMDIAIKVPNSGFTYVYDIVEAIFSADLLKED